MEILPGIGINEVYFGISEAEAYEYLGKPDKIYITDFGCKQLQFYNRRLELSFEGDNDNLLGWIEVHHSDAMLFGVKVIGMMQKQVLDLVSNHLCEQPELEDHGSFVSIFYENHWLELQFEFGCLRCINIGVLYDESGEPKWPVKK